LPVATPCARCCRGWANCRSTQTGGCGRTPVITRLTGDAAAKPWLEARIADDDADVREIVAESLQALSGERA